MFDNTPSANARGADTPRAIAMAVRPSSRYQLAEAHLAAAAKARGDADATLKAVINAFNNQAPDVPATSLASVQGAEQAAAAAREALSDARKRMRPLREQHAAEIAKALGAYRHQRASRILSAAIELRAAVTELSEANAEIERAGGEPARLAVPPLDAIEGFARRLVRE
jgi:hypothetical protein